MNDANAKKMQLYFKTNMVFQIQIVGHLLFDQERMLIWLFIIQRGPNTLPTPSSLLFYNYYFFDPRMVWDPTKRGNGL